ncbi:hypothetical protein AA313_de0208908 [Arthrobotrys entomopaga]|nr:hypothetical protein AA313_de0208908 [Arthrobotrys entomopaga]
MATDQNVLIPVKLDAFVFNEPVCNSNKDRVKIAPITQPNYSFLRLGTGYLQSDIMHHADLHNAWPANRNSRFTDLGTGLPFRKRQGVYLHWTMPLVYRSGSTDTKPKSAGTSGKLAGVTSANQDAATPKFPNAPARWLVIRKINDMASVQPEEARNLVKKVTCWVVESDRRWKMEELDDNVDLQVDVSPFIFGTDNSDPTKPSVPLEDQAEVFIGKKTLLEEWKEEGERQARVDLKLLSSSNQLFPDYQPHCSNVFSMLDNFEYKPGQYLTQVDASYYVIGWNWRTDQDLFYVKEGSSTTLRRERLSTLNMEIKGSQKNSDEQVTEDMKKWLNSPDGTRSVCHGTIYNVKWNSQEVPKNVPGDDYAKLVNGTLPVSVGTTPLDALTTYAEAHKDIEKDPTIKRLEVIISKLEKFLLIKDDGVETQFEAKDLLYNWNYSRFEGGQRYYVAGSDKPNSGAIIPEDTLIKLSDLNRHQALFDALSRRVKQLRWRMFSEWWKYCILGDKPNRERDLNTREIVETLDTLIKDLEDEASGVHRTILGLTEANKNFLPGSQPTYYQQRDPTLLVGGVKSGWQPDYLETLKFRLDSQIQGSDTPFSLIGGDDWSPSIRQIENAIPDLSNSMKGLINEFVLLETERIGGPGDSISKQSPLYHDQLEIDKDDTTNQPILGPWRDLWNDTQPWFPLFLEWEVEYAHLAYDKFWTLKEHNKTHGEPGKIHYIIKEDVDIQKELDGIALKDRDYRRLSGRVLILPQPSFSLEAKIRQFFDDTPALPDGNDLLPGDEQFIKNKLRQLGFISGPLAGFSSHLVTLEQGNHVKPILKKPDTGDLTVVPEAIRPKAGLYETSIAKIGIESDVTPYGTSKKKPSNGVSIFKPVAHGQFKFTKLNIIDKFGQTITAIDPRPSKTPNKVWPCISDWYKPHRRPGLPTQPNIIQGDKDDPTRCEYIQVPPTLNQPCRLNGAFLVPQAGKKEVKKPDPGTDSEELENPEVPGNPEEPGDPESPAPVPEGPFWRPTNEWDRPVWGWVVVNYANSGVQVFLPDGTFYREIRLGGEGSVTSPAWIPFKKPKDPSFGNTYEMQQLSLLVAKLGCDKYLTEFVGMINSATVKLQAPPSAYSEFTSSLIGRPMALVNMGWSLELAANELSSQLAEDLDPEKWLLPYPIPDKPNRDPIVERPAYQFKVKLGDRQRGFDGLIGYFQGKPSSECTFGDALHLDVFYSHYSGNDLRGPDLPREKYEFLNIINESNYPVFESHYIAPENKSAGVYETAYNTELSKHTFGALIDPFSPIHAYSGILPVREIVLPNWQWQTAIEKMKAFFHAGPVLVVKDVPPFVPAKELTADTPVKKVLKTDKNEVGVQLPSVSGDQWTWLQPYVYEPSKLEPKPEPKPGDPTLAENPVCPLPPPGPGDDLNEPKESYMGLAIDVLDMKSRLEEGPYTAIEGYLQLADAPAKS